MKINSQVYTLDYTGFDRKTSHNLKHKITPNFKAIRTFIVAY